MHPWPPEHGISVELTPDGAGRIVLDGHIDAGAIGQHAGDALLRALAWLQEENCRSLTLALNSAGAHFEEPLQGLHSLDRLFQALINLRRRNIPITVHTDGWLYGGSAMLAAACADRIVLGPQARMGLFGRRIHGQTTPDPVPSKDFRWDRPPVCRE